METHFDMVTPGWRFVHVGFEGDEVEVAGIRPWSVGRWMSADRVITVAHPSHPRQRHTMSVYRVAGSAGEVTFAAGEFSNGVWGFYVPE